MSGFTALAAPLPTVTGDYTAAVPGGLLSLTAWVPGYGPTEAQAATPEHLSLLVPLLAALHSVAVPPDVPHWRARIAPDFARRLDGLLARPWRGGPQGEPAQTLLLARRGEFGRWERGYDRLVRRARSGSRGWVLTHGEPHFANQLRTEDGLILVDWETVALAPAERDGVDLPAAQQRALGMDAELIRLFRLEWLPAEIEEYAARFSRPHQGTADDRTALADLREQLDAACDRH